MALTPAMQQYYEIKSRYREAILLFRMGDFYETFGEDAKIASKELDIVLTSRSHDEGGEKIPLAGVPYHAVDAYLSRLVKKGYKVAICEQVEDPKLAKGLVKREVVRVVTPGTVIEGSILQERSNNYLMSMVRERRKTGLAFADVSTGEFMGTEFEDDGNMLETELSRFRPAECILEKELFEDRKLVESIKSCVPGIAVYLNEAPFYEAGMASGFLREHFGVVSLEGMGCEDNHLLIKAAASALHYLRETQKNSLKYITRLQPYFASSFMVLDSTTIRNLELVRNIRDGGPGGTLLELLDFTLTPMGARTLRKWLLNPMLDVEKIRRRLDAVEEVCKNTFLKQDLKSVLKRIRDIERLVGRIGYGNANARDLNALKFSLECFPKLKTLLQNCGTRMLKETEKNLSDFEDIVELVESGIVVEPSNSVREGGIIKEGYNKELDSLREASKNCKKWIAELETMERRRTGIKSLKVGYNQVFGYYIEVTNPNLSLVPNDYVRKQTLATCERFITPELKEKEELILTAEEKIIVLEYELFSEIRERIAKKGEEMLRAAQSIGELDVIVSFAEVAVNNNYAKPEINNEDTLFIKEGRHPTVEKTVNFFVPNDTLMDNRENQLIILTGPNMAGKSTYMRQIALISIMAQIGSFVSAKYASLGIVDRVFTRIGAFDDLTSGQSTFMVEMVQVANILNSATPKSLILLDEIGRGTSTFDGLSIAWAVAEYIHNRNRVGTKTLFATHYHHLTELTGLLERAKNFHVAVKENKEEITFLRKVVPGSTDRSYGIQVAKLAGLPKEVVEEAKEVLRRIEKTDVSPLDEKDGKRKVIHTQLMLFEGESHPVLEEIKKMDVDSLTPLEAISKLYELKKKAGG